MLDQPTKQRVEILKTDKMTAGVDVHLGIAELKLAKGPGGQKPPDQRHTSARVIKLNNFTLWSASGSALPFLSVYFLHYTQATPNDVGVFMLISSLLGIVTSFSLSSLADRFQAHRLVFLCSLLLSYASYIVLFIPILWLATKTEGTAAPSGEQLEDEISEPQPADELQQVELNSKIDLCNPIWFYIIGVCVALGNLSSVVNMNFSDSFSSNMAARQQREGKSKASSFGSLRFFGGVGWLSAAFGLSVLNKLFPELPYLMSSWLLYVAMASANILIVLFWPDGRAFDLAEKNDARANPPTDNKAIIERKMLSRGWLGNVFEREQVQAIAVSCTDESVRTASYKWYRFDECIPDAEYHLAKGVEQRQVRRCSIAPLGRSYICERFVINTGEHRADATTSDHFKFIAKIEPLSRLSTGELARAQWPDIGQAMAGGLSFKLYLKIIELLARRSKNMVRFMCLYVLAGFIITMNWVYLFPYLEALDERKFKTLSAYVMVSRCSSETLFFYLSARITPRLSPANGLSFVFVMFAVRYALYVTFSHWPASAWPLELMIVVELLQSVSQGWFDCILNESALEFALEAERCVPELIELGLMPNTPESMKQVKNGVKLTLFSVSSCCFDGLGSGLGSLAGGWLIGNFDFTTLWASCACLALLTGLANVAFELSRETDTHGNKDPSKS